MDVPKASNVLPARRERHVYLATVPSCTREVASDLTVRRAWDLTDSDMHLHERTCKGGVRFYG